MIFQNASDDEVRELRKQLTVLKRVESYLSHMNQMNAALHMSDTVLDSPLTASVKIRRETLSRILAEHQADEMGG